MSDQPAQCQLYLTIETHPDAIQQLAAALDAAAVAAVLVRAAGGGAIDAPVAKSLIELAQSRNVAALIEADMQLALTLRADGVHLPPGDDLTQRFETAREILGAAAMIGAAPGASRHEAMELAELGADYIAFGAMPDGAEFNRDELLQWWFEIFQVPCVAFDIADAGEAMALARTGVDFVALALPATASPADGAAAVRGYARAVALPVTA